MNVPTAERLADEAGRFLADWKNAPSWEALLDHALTHLTQWPALLGANLVERLDILHDGGLLLEEASRTLAIKAAACLLASGGFPAMLPVADPVEEAAHALTAQVDLLRAVTESSGIRLVQHTYAAPLPYRPGCLTHAAYVCAWGEPPPRYWLAFDTVTHRRNQLLHRYASVGLRPGRHTLAYETQH